MEYEKLLEDNKYMEKVKSRGCTERLPLRQTKDTCGAYMLFQLDC